MDQPSVLTLVPVVICLLTITNAVTCINDSYPFWNIFLHMLHQHWSWFSVLIECFCHVPSVPIHVPIARETETPVKLWQNCLNRSILSREKEGALCNTIFVNTIVTTPHFETDRHNMALKSPQHIYRHWNSCDPLESWSMPIELHLNVTNKVQAKIKQILQTQPNLWGLKI